MDILYKIYQLFVALPILLVLTLVTCLFTIIGCTVGDAAFWSYWPARCWSRCMCFVLLLPVKVSGREHLRSGVSYVFAPNHQGAFDIFLVYGYLGRHFKWMMKKSLRKIPMVGRACESAGHIFVDKSGPKAMAHTMEQARGVLRHGVSVVAFPEGERTLTGQLGAFRRGPFQLAAEIGLDVVPIVIGGCFKALPRQRGFGFVTFSRLTMTVLPPIAHEGETAETLRDKTREAIAASIADSIAAS